jgi:biopolymer transport protein ExbB
MAQLLEQGGWVLVAILALSFVAWFLVVQALLVARRQRRQGWGWAEAAVEALGTGAPRDALALCESQRSPERRVLAVAIRRAAQPGRDARRAPRRLLEAETQAEQSRLARIAVLAAIAPLLGLLGTVQGMAGTFAALASPGAEQARLLARGISEALITTEAGLVVALPVLLAHAYLRAHLRRRHDTLALYLRRVEAVRHGDA